MQVLFVLIFGTVLEYMLIVAKKLNNKQTTNKGLKK